MKIHVEKLDEQWSSLKSCCVCAQQVWYIFWIECLKKSSMQRRKKGKGAVRKRGEM